MWIKCYSSKWRWLVYILIYIFWILIPALYSITATLPPDNELLQTSGELFFTKYIPRRGSLTTLKTPNGEMTFTCGDHMGSPNDCYVKKEVKQRIQGKFATISWYGQPIYLWSRQNRLVELRVDGEKVISREMTQKNVNRASKYFSWAVIISIFVIIGLDFMQRRILKLN
jgi:hypothetical protein